MLEELLAIIMVLLFCCVCVLSGYIWRLIDEITDELTDEKSEHKKYFRKRGKKMTKEECIKFAGYMEEYLNVPSFVCEVIEAKLMSGKYEEVCKFIVQRKDELANNN